MATSRPESNDLSDAFVKISFQEDRGSDPLIGHWLDQGSAKHSSPLVLLSQLLQKLYPGYSLVTTRDSRLDIHSFPHTHVEPISPPELVVDTIFASLPKNSGSVPGVLLDSVEYGAFKAFWQGKQFILYTVRWPLTFGETIEHFILHEGPASTSRELLLAVGVWADQLHKEIWVYDKGWSKDTGLWQEIQKARWEDVILEFDFKTAIQKDVLGFFSSKDMYKALTLPWKRGLILYGPPGNGKTISIKVIMKECLERGYYPMYVKSLKHFMGDEFAISEVFKKARQNSPCVVILEDLDSQINDQNRSFFLNELDGLQSNDGLLLIGSTNHLDRLDPGLSTRPSRFDRKYLFDNPDKAARVLYAQFWQGKLKDNKDVSFPDSLVAVIADETERFSFAYMKEAFVSALVMLLTEKEDGHLITFETVIKEQIKTLRKQLDEVVPKCNVTQASAGVSPRSSTQEQDVRPVLGVLSQMLGGGRESAVPATRGLLMDDLRRNIYRY